MSQPFCFGREETKSWKSWGRASSCSRYFGVGGVISDGIMNSWLLSLHALLLHAVYFYSYRLCVCVCGWLSFSHF